MIGFTCAIDIYASTVRNLLSNLGMVSQVVSTPRGTHLGKIGSTKPIQTSSKELEVQESMALGLQLAFLLTHHLLGELLW